LEIRKFRNKWFNLHFTIPPDGYLLTALENCFEETLHYLHFSLTNVLTISAAILYKRPTCLPRILTSLLYHPIENLYETGYSNLQLVCSGGIQAFMLFILMSLAAFSANLALHH
jgi:hypothetical protein